MTIKNIDENTSVDADTERELTRTEDNQYVLCAARAIMISHNANCRSLIAGRDHSAKRVVGAKEILGLII